MGLFLFFLYNGTLEMETGQLTCVFPPPTSAARSVSQPFSICLSQQGHGGISSSRPGAGFAGAQADHPFGVAPLECQIPGQGSLGHEKGCGELVGTGQQQEAVISEVDPSFSSQKSGVRAAMS